MGDAGTGAGLPAADKHTLAKHAILRKYLNAWIPIIGSKFDRFVMIDGFCGPGVYECGNPGSPIVSLDATKMVKCKIKGKATFHFNDNVSDYISTLESEIDKIKPLPDWVSYEIHNDDFENSIWKILRQYSVSGSEVIPMFLFLDPFGIKIPFNIVHHMLKESSGEVLVYFHPRGLITNATNPNEANQRKACEVFGNDNILEIVRDSTNRYQDLLDEYQSLLEKHAKYVRQFGMYDKSNKVIYNLFFATNNDRGYVKMKEAMWKVDESGNFEYSDATSSNQTVMFSAWDESVEQVVDLLHQVFGAREGVYGAALRNYLELETIYIKRHLTAAFKILRERGILAPRSLKTDGKPYTRGCPDEAILDFTN